MNKIILLSSALLMVLSSQAQTNVYTLSEIVQLARSNSTAWLSAETRKENQYWAFKTFQADYKPSLWFSGTLPEYVKGVESVTQNNGDKNFTDVNYSNLSADLSLGQVIGPTGGKIAVKSTLRRYDNFVEVDTSLVFNPNPPTQYSGNPITISLDQPIFQFNPYKWNKRIKPLVYEESQKVYFEELEQISINATRRFFDLLLAQINLQIAQKNVESNDTIYQIANGRFNLGKITENDLLQLELNLVNSKLAVTQALVDQESASLNLKSYVGLPEKESIQLVLPKKIPDFKVDENVALQEAKNNKSDMVNFKRRELEAQEDVALQKSESGVNMSFNVDYGITNRGATLGEVYNNPENSVVIGLTMSVPILDWGRQKAVIKTAQAGMKLVEYQLIQDKITFEEEVLTQVRNFNMLRDQLEAKVRADEIAQRAYDISKQLFLIGKITITELNASLASKDKAKQEYVSSLRDFWLAYYQLREKTLYDFHHNQLLVRDIQID